MEIFYFPLTASAPPQRSRQVPLFPQPFPPLVHLFSVESCFEDSQLLSSQGRVRSFKLLFSDPFFLGLYPSNFHLTLSSCLLPFGTLFPLPPFWSALRSRQADLIPIPLGGLVLSPFLRLGFLAWEVFSLAGDRFLVLLSFQARLFC